MSGIQWVGIAVTVELFVLTHAVAVFKWISTLTASLKEITARFEERTSVLVFDMRKISESVGKLAEAVVRFERIEEVSRDHEIRIRTLEQEDGE
jgi:hypothetical protein